MMDMNMGALRPGIHIDEETGKIHVISEFPLPQRSFQRELNRQIKRRLRKMQKQKSSMDPHRGQQSNK